MKPSKEFKNFENMARELLKVPHAEIKAKLEAEKEERVRKKKAKTKRPD
jgi:hypothetical protein